MAKQTSPRRFVEYAGMSYEQASRAASDLLHKAVETGEWTKDLPERLMALRSEMKRARPNG